MTATAIADDGANLPLESLPTTYTYENGLVKTITVTYAGATYRQTFTNNGTAITSNTGWVKIS